MSPTPPQSISGLAAQRADEEKRRRGEGADTGQEENNRVRYGGCGETPRQPPQGLLAASKHVREASWYSAVGDGAVGRDVDDR
eukprot:3469618-Rhodomonas_salina.2